MKIEVHIVSPVINKPPRGPRKVLIAVLLALVHWTELVGAHVVATRVGTWLEHHRLRVNVTITEASCEPPSSS